MTQSSLGNDFLGGAIFLFSGVIALAIAVFKFGELRVRDFVLTVFVGVVFLIAASGMIYRGLTGNQPADIMQSTD